MTRQPAPAGRIHLPPQLTVRLRMLVRRVRRIQIVRGAALTLAVALVAVLIIMAVDAAILITADSVRWGLSLCGALFTGTTLWAALVRPLSQPITLVKMARVLETRHPELQERISSAIELLAMGDAAAAQGSRQLIELLAKDARIDLARVSARQEFKGRIQRPALIGAGVGLAALGLLLAAWPGQTRLLLKRAVAPHRSYDNIHAASMRVLPGDARVLAGMPLTIRLFVPADPGHRAEVAIEEEGRPPAIERMRRTSDDNAPEHSFELTLPTVARSFRYRMRFGSGLTRYYHLEVVPPPAHGDLVLDYRFPAYTGSPPTQTVASATGPIRGIAGTRMQLSTRLSRPLEAGLLLDGRRLPATQPSAVNPVWTWLLATNTATRWAVALRDGNGFTNTLAWAGYEVEPDRPPNVQLIYPSGASYTLPTYGLLRMTYTLSDDFGLGAVKLHIQGDGQYDEWDLDVTVEPKGPGKWIVNRELHLSEFQLSGMRRLRIRLSVEDNLPPELGGPNRSSSRVIALDLDDRQTRSLADQVRAPQRDSLTNLITAAVAKLDEAARIVEAIKTEELAATDIPSEVRKRLADAETQAVEAAERMHQAAREAETSLFAGVLPELKETSIKALAPAIVETEAILLAEPELRVEQMRNAHEALQLASAEAEARIEEVLAKDALLARAAAIEHLAGLERQQAEQASARQMTGEEMKTWRQRQEDIAGQIREAGSRLHPDAPAAPEGQAPASPEGQPPAPSEAPSPVPPPEIDAIVDAIRAANEALERQLARPSDETALMQARETETLAHQTQQAANRALDAARQAGSLAANRDALALAKAMAEETQTAAREIEEAALQVRLHADMVRLELTASPADEARLIAAQAAKAAATAETAARLALQAGQQQRTGEDETTVKETARRAIAQAAQALEAAKQTATGARQAEEKAVAAGDALAAASSRQAAQAAEHGQRAAELARQAAVFTQTRQPPAAAEKGAEALAAAREALKLAEDARQEADRAAQSPTALAAQTAQEARTLAEAVQKAVTAVAEAHADHQNAPGEAAKAALKESMQQAGAAQTAAQRQSENARQAQQKAQQAGESMAAEAGRQAQQANEHSRRAAEAAHRAAQMAEANRKPQAENKLQEARRLADDAAKFAENAAKEVEKLARQSADTARRAEAEKTARTPAEQAQQAAEAAARDAAANADALRRLAQAIQADADQTPAATKTAAEAAKAAATDNGEHAQQTREAAAQALQAARTKDDQRSAAAAQQAQQAAETSQRATQQTLEAARLVEDGKIDAAREKIAAAVRLAEQAGEQAAAAQAAAAIARQAPFEQARQIAAAAGEKAQRAEQELRSLAPEPPDAGDANDDAAMPTAEPPTPAAAAAMQVGEAARQARQAAELTQGTAARMQRGADEAARMQRGTDEAARMQRGADEAPPPALTAADAADAMQDADQAAQMAREAAQAAETAAGQAAETVQGLLTQATAQADTARKQAQEAEGKAARMSATPVVADAPDTMQKLAEQIKAAAGTTQAAAQKARDSTQTTLQAPAGQARQGEREAHEAARLAQQAAQQAGEAARRARAGQTPEEEQQEAARLANKAAQQLRRMAVEQARAAGLDPETMLPDEENRQEKSDKTRKKRQPMEQPGGGKGGAEEEEEYEDGESMPALLRRIGFPKLAWARFDGTLDTGMFEGALQHVDPEYRDLVRRYFILLASEMEAQ